MATFKTPAKEKNAGRATARGELETPIKIPASPFLEQIGYGTGVTVYMLERSPRIGSARSPWAIKKWRGENKTNDDRLQLEANVLRQLDHPNIVGFRAFTIGSDGKPCLALEVLQMSLDNMIEQRLEVTSDPFPAKDIMKVGYEIAKGLNYLHNTAHILHGDLKSGNILVTDNFNEVKICDFGHSLPLTESLVLDTSKHDYYYIGTKCWNPPEVINEDEPTTSAADIWTYGLVLWEMIALSPPHVDISEDESADESITECSRTMNENDDSDEITFLKRMSHAYKKYGTRPALPAFDFGAEYEEVFEVFFICTENYKLRPSARALVKYFEKCAEDN